MSEVDWMALKLTGAKCRVAMTSSKDGDSHVSHVFCESKLHGVRCRLEGVPGKKAYVLCNECFQPVHGSKTRR